MTLRSRDCGTAIKLRNVRLKSTADSSIFVHVAPGLLSDWWLLPFLFLGVPVCFLGLLCFSLFCPPMGLHSWLAGVNQQIRSDSVLVLSSQLVAHQRC